MHLDLQSMINYIALGILVILLSVTIFSLVTNKVITLRKKKEEGRLKKHQPKQFYTSSKVYTYSVPENLSGPVKSSKTIEHISKPVERFQVLNDTLNQNAPTFTYRHWN